MGRFAQVLLAAAAIAGRAHADPQTGPDAKAPSPPSSAKDAKLGRHWLAVARSLMERGAYYAAHNRQDDARLSFENAVAAYHRAIDAGDDLNVYVDLAAAEDRIGKPDEAVRHLRILVHAASGVRPEAAKRAQQLLEQLSTKIGLVTLSVTPAGTSITLGGSELGESPLPEALVLLPGTYTLAFQAAGFEPREAEIKVEPGSETERIVQLEPTTEERAPAPPQAAAAAVVARPPAEPPRPAMPLYLGAGATGVAVAATSVLGVLAVAEHSTFTAAHTSAADRDAARTRGERFALAADISLGTAVVAAGFTAYWYYFRYRSVGKPESARAMAAKLDVVPWVQSLSGGVAIAGRF